MNRPVPPAVVITTIQPPTESVRRLAAHLGGGATLLVVGDGKGPATYPLDGVRLLTLADQLGSRFALARTLPVGHYTRKNVGYLEAMASGAPCIYETDDDNHPLPGWRWRTLEVSAQPVRAEGWYNAYAHFSGGLVWPRGFPLDRIRTSLPEGARGAAARTFTAPIQQGLADGSPDVDAVWRLVLDRDVRFTQAASIHLEAGTWCPFNSQSTWWWPAAWPLMYLPSHCSFRMTDIWRGFVAQRCLWELGHGLVFHGPEVEQVRNDHDLMVDFRQEVPGYLGNAGLARVLSDLPLAPGPGHAGRNLRRCYEALVGAGYLPGEELGLVDAWLGDLAELGLHG